MLTHQNTPQVSKSHATRLPKSLCRITAIAAMAALAATVSVSSHAAGGGEALDIELPSMRTPIEATQAPSVVVAAQGEPLTRADVRESLAMARLANLVTPGGEMGDTADVLQAREDFNALQTEVLQAENRTAALQLQQAQLETLVAQAEGYASSAGTSTEAAEPMQDESAAAEPAVEVVVVSSDKVYEMLLEGGHSADMARAKGPEGPEGPEANATEAPVTVLLLVNESEPD